MRKLKVYGGMPFNDKGNQERCAVAAYSEKEVAEIMGATLYEIRGWWGITGNDEELRRALANPHTPIWMGRF